MSRTVLLPLTPQLIDEGRFIDTMEHQLRELQRQMCEFVKTHNYKAAKASGKLKIEVSLTVFRLDDNGNPTFAIRSSVRSEMPKAPATITTALVGNGDDDKPCLFVQSSGSHKDDPRQTKLATEDGRTIIEGKVID